MDRDVMILKQKYGYQIHGLGGESTGEPNKMPRKVSLGTSGFNVNPTTGLITCPTTGRSTVPPRIGCPA